MSNFTIFTDSCCDLPQEQIQALDITVLPLSFTMKGISYQNRWENPEMDLAEFYSRLRKGEMATTSAVNVGQFQEAMGEALCRGKDILVLAFSSALSTTCQSAQIAASELQEQYPNRKIYVVDTLCASMGQGLLVYLAAQKAREGCSIQEVRDWAEATKGAIGHQFTVDELGFLKRGGRISTATAVVGTMLAVKPLLHVNEEGKLVSLGKARGRKGALNALVKKLVDTAKPGLDTVFIAHGDCAEEATAVAEDIRGHFPQVHIELAPMGPVIGAHAGPGTVALFYLSTQR